MLESLLISSPFETMQQKLIRALQQYSNCHPDIFVEDKQKVGLLAKMIENPEQNPIKVGIAYFQNIYVQKLNIGTTFDIFYRYIKIVETINNSIDPTTLTNDPQHQAQINKSKTELATAIKALVPHQESTLSFEAIFGGVKQKITSLIEAFRSANVQDDSLKEILSNYTGVYLFIKEHPELDPPHSQPYQIHTKKKLITYIDPITKDMARILYNDSDAGELLDTKKISSKVNNILNIRAFSACLYQAAQHERTIVGRCYLAIAAKFILPHCPDWVKYILNNTIERTVPIKINQTLCDSTCADIVAIARLFKDFLYKPDIQNHIIQGNIRPFVSEKEQQPTWLFEILVDFVFSNIQDNGIKLAYYNAFCVIAGDTDVKKIFAENGLIYEWDHIDLTIGELQRGEEISPIAHRADYTTKFAQEVRRALVEQLVTQKGVADGRWVIDARLFLLLLDNPNITQTSAIIQIAISLRTSTNIVKQYFDGNMTHKGVTYFEVLRKHVQAYHQRIQCQQYKHADNELKDGLAFFATQLIDWVNWGASWAGKTPVFQSKLKSLINAQEEKLKIDVDQYSITEIQTNAIMYHFEQRRAKQSSNLTIDYKSIPNKEPKLS